MWTREYATAAASARSGNASHGTSRPTAVAKANPDAECPEGNDVDDGMATCRSCTTRAPARSGRLREASDFTPRLTNAEDTPTAATPAAAARLPRRPPNSASAAAMATQMAERVAAFERRRSGSSSAGDSVEATASYTAWSIRERSRSTFAACDLIGAIDPDTSPAITSSMVGGVAAGSVGDGMVEYGTRRGLFPTVGRGSDMGDATGEIGAGRRASAVLAVLLGIAAVATAIFGVTKAGAVVLVGLPLCIVVLVVGLWYVVSRRGAVRVVGALIAAAALIGFLALALSTPHKGLLVVLTLLLAALSGGAARFALARDPRAVAAMVASDRTPAPRPSHPVLLMNPKSGGGKVEKFALADECRRRGIEPVVLRLGDDLLALADAAIDRGADVIGMAGGDGSQALVATVASRRGVPHVCIPAGTRNHFALDLGLDRDDVVGALDAFTEAYERTIDLATVNGHVFVNNASLGLYAKIVQSDAYRDAKAQTAADMLPDMLGPDAEPFDLRFTGPDGREYPTAHLILVSNNPYELDHLAGRGTRARLDTGTLGIVATRIADASAAVAFVAAEAAGRIRSFPGWTEWSAPRFEVASDAPVEIGIDGESMKLDPPLAFQSMAGALRVRIPMHAAGFAPAAASTPAVSGTTLRALLRTAAGRP